MFSCLQILEAFLWFVLITLLRSEERFSRNAETDLVCRLLLEKKNKNINKLCNKNQILHTPQQFLFFIISYGYHKNLHSFPTRRSSDLISGKTVKLMVLALICLGNNRQD